MLPRAARQTGTFTLSAAWGFRQWLSAADAGPAARNTAQAVDNLPARAGDSRLPVPAGALNQFYAEHDILVITEDGNRNITGFPYGPEHNIIGD